MKLEIKTGEFATVSMHRQVDTDGIYFVPPAVAASLWEAPGTVKEPLVAVEEAEIRQCHDLSFLSSGENRREVGYAKGKYWVPFFETISLIAQLLTF